jgi:hypothetical protein
MRTLFILLLCIAAAQAADIPNGIYAVKWKGEGQSVKITDGRTVVLGRRLTGKFGTATITSVANDNSRFQLNLYDAGPFAAKELPWPLAFYVDGVCGLFWAHSELAPDGTAELSASITGTNHAKTAAKKLGVKPALRRHPGHRLLTTFARPKPSYSPGVPVMLRMRIKNVGKGVVQFVDGGQQRGARNNQFGFIAFGPGGKAVPDTGDPLNFGGKGSFITLKSGEVFTKHVDVTKWFDFKKPGRYDITGMYELQVGGTQPFSRMVWDDHAVGRCAVTIAGGGK